MLRDRAIRVRMPRAGETSMKTLRAVCPYTRMLHTIKTFSSKALDRSQSAYLPLSEPPQGRGLSRRPGWTRLRQTIPTRTAAPPPPLPPLEESAPAASPSPQPSQGPPTTRLTVPGQLQLEGGGGRGRGRGGKGTGGYLHRPVIIKNVPYTGRSEGAPHCMKCEMPTRREALPKDFPSKNATLPFNRNGNHKRNNHL